MIAAKSFILADKLNLKEYNTVGVAELTGMKYLDVNYILCYSPDSGLAPELFKVLQDFRRDHLDEKSIFFGDFNVHNPDWIPSTTPLDTAGVLAQEFSELYGLAQLIDFPTRNGNTLDLVFTDIQGTATKHAHLGTSDHCTIVIEFEVSASSANELFRPEVLHWRDAPWPHMKGASEESFKRVERS